VINGFAFALLIGVIVGTYSSIFIASPILVGYFNRRLAKRKK
jgi:preprotein translocase subunit SecF